MDNSYRDTIRSVPIADYAERLGLHTRSVSSGKYVSLKEYDSVRIDLEKNCFWRNSNGASGSIIDFAIEFSFESGCSNAKEAMDSIAEMYGIERSKPREISNQNAPILKNSSKSYEENKNVEKNLILPNRKMIDGKPTIGRAWHYLIDERKIDKSVVNYFLKHDMLYQDERNNCVFKTNDFACLRSTGEKKFSIDVKGCNYNEGFFFRGNDKNKKMYVCEGVIDVMSVMSLRAMKNQKYTDSMYLSLSGVGKTDCIYNHLDKETNIESIYLCFDNDEAGRKAFKEVSEKINTDYPNIKVIDCVPTKGKDWNEYLVNITSPKEDKQMSLNGYVNAIEARKKENPIENNKDDSLKKDKADRRER